MEVRLETRELHSLITKVLSAYLDGLYPTQKVLIDEDHFWNIEKESLYDAANGPREFNLGSLHDVVIELKKLANKDDTYIPANIDIRRISFLIRYLSGI